MRLEQLIPGSAELSLPNKNIPIQGEIQKDEKNSCFIVFKEYNTNIKIVIGETKSRLLFAVNDVCEYIDNIQITQKTKNA